MAKKKRSFGQNRQKFSSTTCDFVGRLIAYQYPLAQLHVNEVV